jgi:threonyl-tRNA synthetase
MVHRALMGSIERFFGILIEHFAGAFPLWLAPVQAILLPITEQQNEFATDLLHKLRDQGIRAEIDLSSEKLGHKIRSAQLQKVPHMLVIGGKEQAAGEVSLRSRKDGDVGKMNLEKYLEYFNKELEKKS